MYLNAWWGDLFDKFEEEHMETTTLPRYNTRVRAQLHQSANSSQHHTPKITFTNTQVYHEAPQRAVNHIPIANAVINQDTGASLEYRQLIQDETTFSICNKAAANEFGCLAQGVEG
jgi:hypothetical protein